MCPSRWAACPFRSLPLPRRASFPSPYPSLHFPAPRRAQGLQGGPHNHTISALAVALKMANTEEFRSYQRQASGQCVCRVGVCVGVCVCVSVCECVCVCV